MNEAASLNGEFVTNITSTQDRNILITGCSSGIGKCVAQGLHQRGYRVFASVRDPGDCAPFHAAGMECLVLDYCDSSSIQSAVEEVLDKTDGKLYALFNNGAYGQPGACEDLSRAAIRQQFETNVFGWMELTNLIIPVMRAQGYGRIIQNSSILVLVASMIFALMIGGFDWVFKTTMQWFYQSF